MLRRIPAPHEEFSNMVKTRFWLRHAALTLTLLLTVILSASAARAEKIFLFIEEAPGRAIAGESTERTHANWIVAESFGWGVTQQSNQGGGRGGVPKPKF